MGGLGGEQGGIHLSSARAINWFPVLVIQILTHRLIS